MKLSKKQREELKKKFGGRCAYCGCELPEKGWHADHVEAVIRDFEMISAPAWSRSSHVARQTGKVFRPENDTIENLFPACAPCNLFKATYSVEGFRKEISAQADRARAYSVNFRTAERFGLIQITSVPVVFWFERYQSKVEAA